MLCKRTNDDDPLEFLLKQQKTLNKTKDKKKKKKEWNTNYSEMIPDSQSNKKTKTKRTQKGTKKHQIPNLFIHKLLIEWTSFNRDNKEKITLFMISKKL